MNKKISLGAAIAYMAIVAAITFSITKIYSMNSFNAMMENINQRENNFEKISEVDRLVRENFYGNIDTESVNYATVKGLIEGLNDKNSYYMTQQEYELFKSADTGRYVGIGVVVERSDEGYIKVMEVYPESSAALAGVKVGDIFVSVNDVPVNAENYTQLAKSLVGEAGTKVKLVRRVNNEEDILNIVRRDIDIPTVKYKVIGEGVGYISFDDIKVGTAHQLEKAIKTMQDEKATSLVLDLRDIQTDNEKYIVSMLQVIMPQGNVANRVYKNGKVVSLGKATTKGITMPITLLINERTSGTIELFAEALHGIPNCKIVGTRTAGNGLAKEVIKISDGSAMILTTSVYETNTGAVYNNKGVMPDFAVVMDVDETQKDTVYGNIDIDTQLRKAYDISLAFAKTQEVSDNVNN